MRCPSARPGETVTKTVTPYRERDCHGIGFWGRTGPPKKPIRETVTNRYIRISVAVSSSGSRVVGPALWSAGRD